MKQALGLVEVQGLSTAMVTADVMAKAANVGILEVENTRGGGLMTIKVTGDVGAVNASVQAGRQTAEICGKLVGWKVIPRPSEYVEKMFCHPGGAAEQKKTIESAAQEKPLEPAETQSEPMQPEAVQAGPPQEPQEPEAVREAGEAEAKEPEHKLKSTAQTRKGRTKKTEKQENE